jgi:hypothetical protein
MTTSTEQLGTYLNDHLAGASAGVEMARRLQDDVTGEPEAAVLGPLADEIEEDLKTLRGLVDLIGIQQNPVKQVAGWVGEKAHRVGVVAETLTAGPHLKRLLEAESMSLGVEGKLCLWLALIEMVPDYPQLTAVDLPALAERARDQRRRIEAVRLAAVVRAFGGVGRPS